MTERVNVQDAKTRLSELLARVERGEEFIVARGGNPVAKLSPIGDPPLRELGFVPGGPVRVAFFEDLPDDELTAWDGK